MARRIEVEIVGDSRSLERAFKKSARSATVFERQVKGVGHHLKAAFGVAAGTVGLTLGFEGLVKGIERSVDAAEDLHKEMSKSATVFGASQTAIVTWSKTTADALGINQAAALRAASNYGLLFNTLGKGQQVSADMSRTLVRVAADLASFFHVAASDVLTKLRAGLYGQARGIKVLGINMTSARVNAEAYRDGIAQVGSKLTEAQKVQARYNIILRDSRPALGNFAAHAKDLANTQARLSATFEDLFAAVGEKLLPVITDLANRFEAWLSNADNQKRIIDDVTSAVNAMAGAVEFAANAWGKLHDASSWFDKHHLGFLNKGALQDFKDLRNWVRGTGGGGGGMTPDQWRRRLDSGPMRRSVVPDAWYRAHGFPTPSERRAGGPVGGRLIVGPRRPDLARQAGQRNLFFDNMLARQLDRVQDLGLRKQLDRLRQLAAEVRGRLAITHDTTRRLTLEDKLLDILRQQKQVQADITDQIKQANQALKDRAEAIKSAILDRLQRRQTDILNKRAMQDALEQLRIARQLGGPKGIRAAQRAVTDARLAQLIARAEGAPASLTRGGRFALGNVITINIHGVTDPDAVARKVSAILNRRARRTTTQVRGPAAGQTAGTH